MQPQDGALLFQVRADQSQIQKDVEAIKKQFEQMTNKAVEEGKKQANVWQTLLKGATAYFTLQGAQSFISQMVAADRGDVDELRTRNIGKVAYKERGQDGQCLDVQVNHLRDFAELLCADDAVAAEAGVVDPCPDGEGLYLLVKLYDMFGDGEVSSLDNDIERRVCGKDLCAQRVQPLGTARNEDEIVSARGKCRRCGGADARTGTGDDGVLRWLLVHHEILLVIYGKDVHVSRQIAPLREAPRACIGGAMAAGPSLRFTQKRCENDKSDRITGVSFLVHHCLLRFDRSLIVRQR